MKKSILYLLFVIISSLNCLHVYADEIILGPSESCPDETKTYTLSSLRECFLGIDEVYAVNGTVISYDYDEFTIQWQNNTSSSIDGQIFVEWSAGTENCNEINGEVYCSCEYDGDNFISGSINKTITINSSGDVNVSTPSPITSQWVAGKSYKFTTSSNNADSYQWQVIGGNINGSSTSSTVQVLATSCNLTVKARGVVVKPCKTNYSSWRTLNFTVPTPGTPGNISGPSYLYPNQTATYSVSPVTYASGYTWSLVDNYGGKLSLIHNYGTNEVQVRLNGCATTYYQAVLSVKAYSLCGNSSQRSTSISYGAASCGNTNSMFIASNEVYPNPSYSYEDITLKLHENEDIAVEKYEIMDMNGEQLRTERLSDNINREIKIHGLPKGLYFLKLYDKTNNVKTKKIIVK